MVLHHDIPAFDKARFAQAFAECGTTGCHRGAAVDKPNYGQTRGLLRAPRERPRRRRAADKRYERAPPHSITSSAISRRRARERSAARLARARGGGFSVSAILV